MWPLPYWTYVSNSIICVPSFFYVRATFLVPYILAVIAFTFFVKTARCEAVHVIEFTLLK